MKSIVLFVATSLILVVAMFAIATPNPVQADKPTWCFNGPLGERCANNHNECKRFSEILGGGKCFKQE